MALAQQMHNMTNDFLHAHDLRSSALKQIVEQTNEDLGDARKMVRDFHSERLDNAETLQKTLGRFTDTLTKEVDQAIRGFHAARSQMSGELHGQLDKFTDTLAKQTKNALKHFHTTHKSLSGQQREDLEKFVMSLEAESKDLCKTAQVMMKGFHKQQQKMGQEFRESIASFAAQNRKQAAQFLNSCGTERKHATRTQRESLAQYVGDNAKGTRLMLKRAGADQKKRSEALHERTEAFLKGVHQTVRQVKKAAHEMTDGFHEDHDKARQSWRQMAASRQKQRAGAEAPAAASGPGKRGEIEGAVVNLLKQSPEGMTLAELSYAMEMPSAATSKTLKHMLKRKDAAIHKNGQLYLAS